VSRVVVPATWDDVPHLTDKQKEDLWNSIPPQEREARAKGSPSLGAGRIYPIAEEELLVDPIPLPPYWPRAYALDVGWNRTAAIWGAWDRDSDTVYLWSEYYAGQSPPAVHASAIRARGNWIPGAVDPASAGASQKDGSRLIDEYMNEGLLLAEADNTVEAGLFAVYQRMARGGLKVFRTLENWKREFRIYRRDEKGKVVKENDHLMDCTRYLIMTGMRLAAVEPSVLEEMEYATQPDRGGRSTVTGY
jgi:hypothetical protein